MKFSILREYLLNLLEKASSVSGSSAISPYLQSFLLEADVERNVLSVLRTDRFLSAVAHTDSFELLEDSEPRAVLVHADMLLNLIRNLESENVVIDVPDGYSVQIEADSFKATWMTFNISEFPDLPRSTSVKDAFAVKAVDFVKAIDRVKFAAGKDSVQANFKQICFDETGCWAWDGFTYQQVDFEIPTPFSLPFEAIDVVKFVKLSGVETVMITVSPEVMFFTAGVDMFVSRNPNIPKPNQEVLNRLRKKSPGYFVAEVQQLRRLIKRVGITADNGRIMIDVRKDSVTVSGHDTSNNQSAESIPISFEGEAAKLNRFSLNWEFLDKALSSVSSKAVKISVESGHIILEGEDSYGVLSMLKG